MHERSARHFADALAVMPGGNTRTTLAVAPHPPYARTGSGYELIDADGNVVIDLQMNYTALVHGHAHPAVTEAAIAAVREGSAFGLPTAHDVALAGRLGERMPALERLRFANSGSEAVMMAVRTARAFTGRDAVLRFAGSYHGTYDAALPAAAPGLTRAGRAELVTVPVGDAEAFAGAVDEHGERLACVLLDLMPNRAGLRPVPPELVALVRAETSARGILLVVDEVITGRLAVGGLQAAYGLQADLVTLGKVIGGGFPVGAFGGRADVMAVLDPRRPVPVGHGGTFSANPVSMRAGLAALDLLDAPAIERLNGLGDDLRTRLAGQGWDVAGRGSLLRVLDVAGNPDLWWRLYDAGVLLATNGLAALSTPMDAAAVEEVARRFAGVLERAPRVNDRTDVPV
jgi:glutamate-1-semialdehyde 2,1-aminomutase